MPSHFLTFSSLRLRASGFGCGRRSNRLGGEDSCKTNPIGRAGTLALLGAIVRTKANFRGVAGLKWQVSKEQSGPAASGSVLAWNSGAAVQNKANSREEAGDAEQLGLPLFSASFVSFGYGGFDSGRRPGWASVARIRAKQSQFAQGRPEQ